MATVNSIEQFSINYGNERIIRLQYVSPYTAGITDTDLKYEFTIFLNKTVDTTGDQLLTQNEGLDVSVYRSNTKTYCDYYILYEGTVQSMQENFSSVFDYINLLAGDWTDPYHICVDWDNSNPDITAETLQNVFMEAFFSSAHWCRLLVNLSEIDLNCSYANETFSSGGFDTYFNNWVKVYSDLQNLTFSDTDVQSAYDQEKENVLQHMNELTSPPDFLNENELFSIMLYSSNFYWVINRALRSPSTYETEYDELRGVFLHINTGLWHFKQFIGNTWRGDNLSEDRIKENEKGNDVTNLAYTSTSTSIGTEFIQNSAQVFNFALIDGSSISSISLYPSEDEILVKAHMTYYVVDNAETFQDTEKPLYEVSELKTIRR